MLRRALALAIILGLLLMARPAPAGGLGVAPSLLGARIDPAQLADLAARGISPRRILDYGSFLWLLLTPDDADRLPPGVTLASTEIRLGRLRADPTTLRGPTSPSAEGSLRLVQLIGPTQDDWLDRLAASGRRVLQYVPHHAYLVWEPPGLPEATASFDFARWSGPLLPEQKLAPNLDTAPVDAAGRIRHVEVLLYDNSDDDLDLARALDRVTALGGRVLQTYPAQPDGAFVSAITTLPAAALPPLARQPNVVWLGYSSPVPGLEDEVAGQIVADNAPGGVPGKGYLPWLEAIGYDGTGTVWAVMDTGVDYDHPDLADRLVGGYSFPGACDPPGQPGSDCADGGHGTHVAGILAGDADLALADPAGFLYGLGVAPGAGLFAGSPLSGGDWPPAGGWPEISRQAVLGGAIGGNNSWTTGEGIDHGYQNTERIHDLMTRDGDFSTETVAEPYIQVFSAGNAGGAGLTAPKEAKNLIVVASSENYRAGDIDEISSFSSRGPATDGRWVPQISAPGNVIASTRNDLGGYCALSIPGTDDRYALCSGTSMAAAHVSGALAVLSEWRRDQAGTDPSPALALALLVNSATDMDDADIPNAAEGWGRVNLAAALRPELSRLLYDQEMLLTDTGQTWELAVTVFDPEQPLKLTLAWSDAPGAAGANPALVNDLDLTVDTGSLTYYGNRFAGGWSLPGGTPDALNNLENVFVASPGDTAVITITAANLAGDGVPYNGDLTDQDFALVCQNCARLLEVRPEEAAICLPGATGYDVIVGALPDVGGPVDLDVNGVPLGVTGVLSDDPVMPPASSRLTVTASLQATPGLVQLDVSASASGHEESAPVQLVLEGGAPAAPEPDYPPDGARNVPRQPSFSWTPAGASSVYRLEVATDPAFADLVIAADGIAGNAYSPSFVLDADRVYFWRVWATNACGQGPASGAGSFLTAPLAGLCGTGAVPETLFTVDFEGGESWSHDGPGDTWELSTERANSGQTSYRATGIGAISDQRLVSPPVVLPAGEAPLTLHFWNYQALEDDAGGCRDGAVLEISQDDGATWLPIEEGLQTDPYDGPISASWGNPLADRAAWCGDPQDWLESIVNLTPYAAETLRFRFRLGTDAITSREGWYVDDVHVQACPQAPYAAGLSPAASERVGGPGEVVTHTFSLSNLGPDDAYDLAVVPGDWETVLQTGTPLTLSYGHTATVTVTVAIPPLPAEAVAGTDAFGLSATSQADSGLVLTATGQTTAVPVPGLLASGDDAQTGIYAETLDYTVRLTSTGTTTDTFTVKIEGNHWTTEAQPGALTLLPGASGTITVAVTVGFGVEDQARLLFISSLVQEPSATVLLTSRTHLMYLPGGVFR